MPNKAKFKMECHDLITTTVLHSGNALLHSYLSLARNRQFTEKIARISIND